MNSQNNKYRYSQEISTIERLIDDSGIYGNPTLTDKCVKDLFTVINVLKEYKYVDCDSCINDCCDMCIHWNKLADCYEE